MVEETFSFWKKENEDGSVVVTVKDSEDTARFQLIQINEHEFKVTDTPDFDPTSEETTIENYDAMWRAIRRCGGRPNTHPH